MLGGSYLKFFAPVWSDVTRNQLWIHTINICLRPWYRGGPVVYVPPVSLFPKNLRSKLYLVYVISYWLKIPPNYGQRHFKSNQTVAASRPFFNTICARGISGAGIDGASATYTPHTTVGALKLHNHHPQFSSLALCCLFIEYVNGLDLRKASPPRRILGLLSTVVVVMDKLSHLLKSHLTRILNLLVSYLPCEHMLASL